MKRIVQITLSFVYLVSIIFSMIVLIKPGASIFYKKSQIQTHNLIPDENAFSYQFTDNFLLYNPTTILVLEDQKVLHPASLEYVRNGVNGTFAQKDIRNNKISIFFVPTDFSDPATNRHNYSIYIRPYLIERSWGGIVFLVLSLGLVGFFGSGLVDPRKRKVLLGSPFGVVRLWGDLVDAAPDATKSFFLARGPFIKYSVVNSVLIAFLYVFMEWVFIVTMPSFMEVFNLSEKVNIFLISGLVVTLLTILVLLAVFLLDFELTPVFPSFHIYAYNFPASFMATCLCLILFDNFTYTIFNFGVVNSRTLVRALYALVFVGIFIYILRKMATSMKSDQKPGPQRIRAITTVFLATISLILAGFSFNPENRAITQAGNYSSSDKKPNIILLATDGLNAENMSVYGYGRDTTPFISDLAKTSFLSENNFTNAPVTIGSEVAVLTGKLPFSSYVIYYPDTLRGYDMYQHLPGILKSNGYETVQLGIPYYLDANSINFKNAFDAVNCKENSTDSLSRWISGYGYDDEIFLLTTIEGRISDRFNHIFFIKDMQNPYTMVTQSETTSITDHQRLECLRSYLDDVKQTGQPLFAQIHLLGTHGAKFNPGVRVFSKNEKQNSDFMTDFYDDSILNFDTEVQQLVQHLKENGQYDNTILILYSDHGEEWTANNKIPLIIHFPKGQYAGTVTENTQNIDIAPTILDYMGISKPAWMEGTSLLGPLDPKRLIIAGAANEMEKIEGKMRLSQDNFNPPFYQFSNLIVTQCQNWYNINLNDMTAIKGVVVGYVNPCSADTLDTQEEIRGKVGTVLKQLGYHLPDNW